LSLWSRTTRISGTCWRFFCSKKGCRILEASDGKQGVQLAREVHPDLILMDLSLPYLSGIQATTMLKNQTDTKSISVVAVSAHCAETRWRDGSSSGMRKLHRQTHRLCRTITSFGTLFRGRRETRIRCSITNTAPLLTNQVGIPDAVLIRGGGMYISLGLLVLIILLVVLLR
jgi:CheY-like chemotaxis protein